MKLVAGRLKLQLAQFVELEAFSQFASDLDKITQKQLKQGARLREMLKQKESSPIGVIEQACIIEAGLASYFDNIGLEDIQSAVAILQEICEPIVNSWYPIFIGSRYDRLRYTYWRKPISVRILLGTFLKHTVKQIEMIL